LENCVKRAIDAPSVVVSARQQILIAKYGITAARAGFLPQLAIANAFTYNSPFPNGQGIQSFVALNGLREYSTLGTMNLNVDTSGRTRAALSRSRADLAIANANLEISRRDLRRLVTTAYYRLLLGRRLVLVARDTLAEAQGFEARTKLLFAGGEVAQADLVKASADVAFRQQNLNNAELEAQLANQDLAAFWTTDLTPVLDIVDTIDFGEALPEPQSSSATPYLRRFEFNLLDAQRTGFLADARRARADLFPQFNLIYQYGLDRNRVSTKDRGYAAFFHFDIPVFDWFRARSTEQQFRLQADQASNARQEAERSFSRDYQDALTRVNSLRQQITLTEKQVQLSADNLRLAGVRYEGGEGLALDVVAAQNQLAQARANLVTTKASYLNARAELEVASGR
jgi:outer membrane protein TolC